MTLLNQIIAVQPSIKSQAERDLTDIHHLLLKPALLEGMTRTYAPFNAEDPEIPGESKRVQVDAEQSLVAARKTLSRLFDARATLDYGNCKAVADVKVGDDVVLDNVPVTYLLFLEKALVNVHTFLKRLPTLDQAETWVRDDNAGAYVTAEPVKNQRFVKVRKNHVKQPATKEHPAQVEIFMEEVPTGIWTTKKFSGALPETRRRELLDRVDALILAVKEAREAANSEVADDQHVAKKIFDYLFA